MKCNTEHREKNVQYSTVLFRTTLTSRDPPKVGSEPTGGSDPHFEKRYLLGTVQHNQNNHYFFLDILITIFASFCFH